MGEIDRSESAVDKGLDSALNASVIQNVTEPNAELGITKDYTGNRKKWDDTKKKEAFKDKTFDGKKTWKDPVSGEPLHREQSAAQNKYHMKNADGENSSTAWASHAAETDHIIPLEELHSRTKNNPFLTDGDLREIANHDNNYRVTSKSLNTSKGASSDWGVAKEKLKEGDMKAASTVVGEKLRAEMYTSAAIAARTAKNAGREFALGAKDQLVDSAIPLMAEGVRHLIHVVQGDESLKDAAKDIGKSTMKIAVAGGSKRIIADLVQGSENKTLKALLGSGAASQILSAAIIVSQSSSRYINGEIDGKEFLEEIGERGAMQVAGLIGGEVGKELGLIIGAVILPGIGTIPGAFIGEVIGTLITTVACGLIISVHNVFKHMDDYKLSEKQVKRLESAALAEMEEQRQEFRRIVERENQHWDNTIQSGFDQLIRSSCEEAFDLAGITGGLDRILSVFGKSARFHSMDEYEAQLNQPLVLSF